MGCALKTSPDAGRQVDLPSGPLDRRHRVAERLARREIERERDGRELSLTAHDERGRCFRNLREHVQRHLAAAQGPDIEELQRLWTLLKLRHHFQHDTILVQLGKHRGHLPLAERVVEGVDNQLWRDAHARRRVAVDDQHGRQPLVLLVAAHVAQFGKRLQVPRRAWAPTGSAPRGPHLRGCTGTACGSRGPRP